MTALRLALSLLAFLSLSAPATAQVTNREAVLAARMINAHRAANGLPPLRVDPRLNAAAADQARAMVAARTMSHDLGGGFRARMSQRGIGAAAENLGQGYRSVGEAVAGWKASWGHNANMLDRSMTRLGFARGDAPGAGPFWALVLSR
jgi:uncharacterized protein YkwD